MFVSDAEMAFGSDWYYFSGFDERECWGGKQRHDIFD
jgi:hypothetical protein